MAKAPKKFRLPLDVAAYVVSQGALYEIVKRPGHLFAEYWLDDTTENRRHAMNFLQGLSSMNLITYLYNRTRMKLEQKQEPMVVPVTGDVAPQKIMGGQGYWYVENGQILHTVYANKEPHLSRLEKGNVYTNRITAQLAATKK
jgi:hypothetical protein